MWSASARAHALAYASIPVTNASFSTIYPLHKSNRTRRTVDKCRKLPNWQRGRYLCHPEHSVISVLFVGRKIKGVEVAEAAAAAGIPNLEKSGNSFPALWDIEKIQEILPHRSIPLS